MPTEVIMPKVDMDMSNGKIVTWHAAPGDKVDKGAPLFDIETDKAAMEIEAPASGILQHPVEAGTDVPIGKPVAWLYAEGEVVDTAPEVETGETTADVGNVTLEPASCEPTERSDTDRRPTDGKVRASPLARRLARENGFGLSAIKGSGPRGRIMRRDVDAHHRTKAPVDDGGNRRPDTAFRAVPVDRMRATIARRLTKSKTTIPHFYLDMDCQLDALLMLRQSLNEAMAQRGRPKISVNDLIIKASALATEAVPEANATFADDAIHRYQTIDISMAVALDDGLVTPVIRDAASLSIDMLSATAADLAETARQGRLSPAACRGGRMTVSNLGMFGIKSFAAIINPPESMILAVGKAHRTFVPDEDDRPLAVTLLPVTLSADHRVIDGAIAARWLQHFRDAIEQPMRLVL